MKALQGTLAAMTLVLAIQSGGCAAQRPYVWVDELDDAAPPPATYRIQAGDQLTIAVWSQSQLTGPVAVRADGRITLPLVGDVAVGGLTPEDAASQIARRLDGVVVDPKVTVAVTFQRQPQCSVVGEVRSPGRFPLRGDEGVLEALSMAGGLTEFAAPDGIYVLRQQPEIQRIRFTYLQLRAGTGKGHLFRLQDGDVVVVE